MIRGVVTSDLHLFARRSHPIPLIDALYEQLPTCEILVLIGCPVQSTMCSGALALLAAKMFTGFVKIRRKL